MFVGLFLSTGGIAWKAGIGGWASMVPMKLISLNGTSCSLNIAWKSSPSSWPWQGSLEEAE